MKRKIWEILNAINPKIEEDMEEDLLKAGLIDSFQIVNIVAELENEFEIEFDPELIISDNFNTIDSITKVIEKIINEEAG